jgi:amidase
VASLSEMAGETWQAIAKEAQEQRDKSIEEVEPRIPDIKVEELPLNVISIPSKYLTPLEIEVTETRPENLVKSLALGELSSVQVTNAFLRRAGIAQKLVRAPLTASMLPNCAC